MKDSIGMGGNPLRRNINKRIIRIQEITLFVIKLRNINQIYSLSQGIQQLDIDWVTSTI